MWALPCQIFFHVGMRNISCLVFYIDVQSIVSVAESRREICVDLLGRSVIVGRIYLRWMMVCPVLGRLAILLELGKVGRLVVVNR